MMKSQTALLTIAMPSEAKPLIKHFKLKQDLSCAHFPIYKNKEMVLIVSGIGKVKSALCTGSVMAASKDLDRCFAVNIGIAGAGGSFAKIGELYLINKIVDHSTNREFYPDMLLRTGLREAEVTTFDRPVKRSDGIAPLSGLVEMEASGFFEAARVFLPPHRIACLKIVSDHLEGKPLSAKKIERLMAKHILDIENFIRLSQAAGASREETLTMKEIRWISNVSSRLRLTASQKRMLCDWAAMRIETGRALPELPADVLFDVSTKKEGKISLEKIRDILLAR